MQAKHTPGPWAYDADSNEVFSEDKQHGCGWIALVKGNDSNNASLPKDERLANAALIAAAPDLLAALREIVTHHGLRASLLRDGFGQQLDAAREVIARATGEA